MIASAAQPAMIRPVRRGDRLVTANMATDAAITMPGASIPNEAPAPKSRITDARTGMGQRRLSGSTSAGARAMARVTASPGRNFSSRKGMNAAAMTNAAAMMSPAHPGSRG